MMPNRRMTLTAAGACVLTSIALYPLFGTSEWFFAGIGAVITVAACGALSRLRALPVLACLAISVLGLLLYLNLAFEGHQSLLRVIPTPTSITRLSQLAGTGMSDASRYAPPTPYLPGLVLLAAGGIGITAVLTDLIAVRLRSTALAGLPLLVLFTVPITMKAPSGVGTAIVFCLATAGYLAMLSADGRERIRVWGRLVSLWRVGPQDDDAGTPARGRGIRAGARRAGPGGAAAGGPFPARRLAEPEPGPDTRALAAAGRRVGLASIVLALCVPLIVPGLHPSKLFSSGPGIGGTGGSGGTAQVALPDALSKTIADLREKSTTLFTYTTTASASLQKNDAQYFRELAYDTLTDTTWQTSDYTAGAVPVSPATALPRAQGLVNMLAGQKVVTQVTVPAATATAGPNFLPLPYPPSRVSVSPGNWLVDPELMVYTPDTVDLKSYQVTSYDMVPAAAQLAAAPLPPASVATDLELPSSYKDLTALKQIAEQVTADAKTEYAKANALAYYLQSAPFGYSTSAPTFNTAAGLLKFVQNTKLGVCVQYAWAMTVLARELGIPARLVQGFTAGSLEPGGTHVVKTSDAHAWTEIYFSGYGWVRFDPTPSGQGTAQPASYQSQVPGGSSGPAGSNTSPGPSSSANAPRPGSSGNAKHPTGSTGGAGAAVAASSTGAPWAAIVLAAVAAIALAAGVIAVAAPPAHRALASHADRPRRRRPASLATAALVAVAAAVLALALYRLLARTSGLDLRAGWATVGVAFGVAAAVMLVTPALGRVILRRWRWMRAADDASRAHVAWREFRDNLEDFGVESRPSEPPRTLAGRVTSGLPRAAREAITRIAVAEERASYAARPAGSANLSKDSAAARRGIAASVRRGRRWRARIFPASVVAGAADAAARVQDRLATLVSRRWAERTD